MYKVNLNGKKNMITKIRYGFLYDGINYGWLNKKLHRLPSVKNKRSLPFKQCTIVNIGNKKGYRLSGDRKTINQLMEMTEVINYVHTINGACSDDCPF